MLICTNCGTTNTDAAVVCVHCKMKGKFRKQEGAATNYESKDNPLDSGAVPSCRNCGQPVKEAADKCPHCQLPVRNLKSLSYDLLSENGRSSEPRKTRLFFN